MKPSSCKAKGRRFQQYLRDSLRILGAKYGLVDADIESRGMGQSGVDIILSPAAQKVFNIQIEAKNVEALSVAKTFEQHYSKYAGKGLVLLAHTKNHGTPLVTMRWQDFMDILRFYNAVEIPT